MVMSNKVSKVYLLLKTKVNLILLCKHLEKLPLSEIVLKIHEDKLCF